MEKYECCRCLDGNIVNGRLRGLGLVGKKLWLKVVDGFGESSRIKREY